jgi:hypothetical protein
MKTHELLDAANLNPAAWALVTGVFFGKVSEEGDSGRDEMMAEILGELGGDGWDIRPRTAIANDPGYAMIDSRFRQRGTCDHCGAWFKFGMVYRHTSGVSCVVGHTCAEKSLSVSDRYTLVLNRARAKVEAAAHTAKMKAQAIKAANEGGYGWLYTVEHADRILIDIASKGLQYGGLTPRQAEFVQRIHSGQHAEDVKAREKAAQDRADARRAEQAASIYMGEVGKPLVVECEVLAQTERTYTDMWPARVMYWHLMKTAAGNFVTYRGSNNLGARGTKVAGTFTVKAHEEYKGTKQTALQRPRKTRNGKGRLMRREPVMQRFYRQLAEQAEWYARCFNEPADGPFRKQAAEARAKLQSVTRITDPGHDGA